MMHEQCWNIHVIPGLPLTINHIDGCVLRLNHRVFDSAKATNLRNTASRVSPSPWEMT